MAEGPSVPLRSQDNRALGEVELPAAVFGAPVRTHLLYEAVRMQQCNRRAGTAATRTRGRTRGGGRKPWRQKGTGRARAGSLRSPLWVGGAVVFGPQPRDYSYRMPGTARRRALGSALALKARAGKVVVVDKIELGTPKTKHVVRLLSDLEVRSAVIMVPGPAPELEKSARNLPNAKVLRVAGANVYDLLHYEHLLLTQGALDALAKRWE